MHFKSWIEKKKSGLPHEIVGILPRLVVSWSLFRSSINFLLAYSSSVKVSVSEMDEIFYIQAWNSFQITILLSSFANPSTSLNNTSDLVVALSLSRFGNLTYIELITIFEILAFSPSDKSPSAEDG